MPNRPDASLIVGGWKMYYRSLSSTDCYDKQLDANRDLHQKEDASYLSVDDVEP